MTIFEFNIFKKHPSLVQGISTSHFGNLSFKYGPVEEVKTNRRRFFEVMGVEGKKVIAVQLEHSDKVYEASTLNWGEGIDSPQSAPVCDILVASEPDVYLFMVVADCLALFLYEPDKQVCALVHAGWKGVNQLVPQKAVEYLVRNHHCKAENLIVGMSPALQASSAKYLAIAPEQKEARWQDYVKFHDGYFYVNSPQYAYQQLLEAGIYSDNIEKSDIDTYQDKRFFPIAAVRLTKKQRVVLAVFSAEEANK